MVHPTDMSRKLRSGHSYDPLVVPPAQRRRSNKGAKGKGDDSQGNSSSELAQHQLVFGTVNPLELTINAPPTYSNAGGRQGFTLGGLQGVRMTPRLYSAFYSRPPPIRNPKRMIASAPESDAHVEVDARVKADARHEADARVKANARLEADASVQNGDAASQMAPAASDAQVVTPPEAA
ncbi:hypothetical protein FRC12_007166 [Ceratobasidium sp. 428]|nr:hypothetical protein FRC12_007166 [Ceratobasidium sp. 428]